MDLVNEVVLESGLVVLTGGRDKQGTPLVAFAADSADLLDIYSAADILEIIKVYATISGEDIVVLADLNVGWTQQCKDKLTCILNELQSSRRHCIKVAYFIEEPANSTGDRVLQRRLLTKPASKATPKFQIIKVSGNDELHRFVDESQLTSDYGGHLQYHHATWIEFQKTYAPIVEKAECALEQLKEEFVDVEHLPTMFADVTLYDYEAYLQTKTSYEDTLETMHLNIVIENCEEAVDKLEHPEFDPSLRLVNLNHLTDMLCAIQDTLRAVHEEVDRANGIFKRFEDERTLYQKLKECDSNKTEVIETLDLMSDQLNEHPRVGSCLHAAMENRTHYLEQILAPSKDIVDCTAAILEDISEGLNGTGDVYRISIAIGKQLSDVIQPFTDRINQLNETYTRIHLFFVLFHKTTRWKTHAKLLLNRTFKEILTDRKCISPSLEPMANRAIFSKANKNGLKEKTINGNGTRLTDLPAKELLPKSWHERVALFHRKHSSPKKKHLGILSKHSPTCLDKDIRQQAATLVERTMFIQALLKKDHIKTGEMMAINSWVEDEDVDVETAV